MKKAEYIYEFLFLIHKALVRDLPEEANEEEYINKSYEMLRKGTKHIKNAIKESKCR